MTNVAALNEKLSLRPEPLREDLAGFILDHLDEFEAEIGSPVLSDELRAELERREALALADPRRGTSWPELKGRLLKSRSK